MVFYLEKKIKKTNAVGQGGTGPVGCFSYLAFVKENMCSHSVPHCQMEKRGAF